MTRLLTYSTAAFALANSIVATPVSQSQAADRNVYPTVDSHVDLWDLTHLVPQSSASLTYLEKAPGLAAVRLNMNLTSPTVILENSAYLRDIQCSAKRDILEFVVDHSVAHSHLSTWNTAKEVIIITQTPTCNAEDERGVFRVVANNVGPESNGSRRYIYKVKPSTLKEVAPVMEIEYDSARKHISSLEKRSAPPTCSPSVPAFGQPANCNVRGVLPASAPITWHPEAKTFESCMQVCETSNDCQAFGWSAFGKLCATSCDSLAQGHVVQAWWSPFVLYNKGCYSCQSSSSTATSTGKTTATSSSATKVTATSVAKTTPSTSTTAKPSTTTSKSSSITAPPTTSSASSGFITTGADGKYTITGIPPDTPQLRADYSSIVSGLSLNAAGAFPLSLGTSTGVQLPAPTFSPNDAVYQASLEQDFIAAGFAAPTAYYSSALAALSSFQASSVNPSSPQTTATPSLSARAASSSPFLDMVKRNAGGEASEWTEAICDAVEEANEAIEAACALAELGEAVYCLVDGHCFDEKAPPTEYDFDYSWKLTWDYENSPFHGDAVSTVTCVDCSLDVTNIEFKGSIVVEQSTNSVLSGSMTISESSVKNAIFGLTTTGPAQGNSKLNVNSAPLSPIVGAGVFSISPSIVYGFGFQWNTDSAVSNVKAGAQMTLSGASAQYDFLAQSVGSPANMQPSLQVTYPAIDPASSLVSLIETTVSMQVQILGNTVNIPASLNTQTNVAFGSSWSNQCGANQDAVIQAVESTTIWGVCGKNQGSLITPNQLVNSYTQCASVSYSPATPSQISLLAASGAAFCSQYIGYSPTAVTTFVQATVSALSIQPTTLQTNTFTPSASTVTTTITASSGASTSSPVQGNGVTKRQFHLAAPTPSVASGWPPQKISSACSKVATGSTVITKATGTTTVYTGTTVIATTHTTTAPAPTVTVTDTVAPQPTAPSSCGNQGLQWAIYPGFTQNSNDWTVFDSTYLPMLSTRSPGATGTITSIGGFLLATADANSDFTLTPYNSSYTFFHDFWSMNHQGYILAPQTGTYTFNMGEANDYLAMWVGPNAYSGWTAANANGENYGYTAPTIFTVNMVAGQYYPYRAVYANSYAGATFYVFITAPDGSNFTTTDQTGNANIVQYSCDGTSAPKFPGWGT